MDDRDFLKKAKEIDDVVRGFREQFPGEEMAVIGCVCHTLLITAMNAGLSKQEFFMKLDLSWDYMKAAKGGSI